MSGISERLAEIEDDFGHLRYDDGCRRLLAAVRAAESYADGTDGGAWLAANVGVLDASDRDLVLYVTRGVREAIAAALAQDTKETR